MCFFPPTFIHSVGKVIFCFYNSLSKNSLLNNSLIILYYELIEKSWHDIRVHFNSRPDL